MDNQETTQIAIPLSMHIDLQLGPDGHPWIRYQVGTPSLTASFVIPVEHSETFIERITEGTRLTAKKATQKQADILVPDFTGIAVAGKNNGS